MQAVQQQMSAACPSGGTKPSTVPAFDTPAGLLQCVTFLNLICHCQAAYIQADQVISAADNSENSAQVCGIVLYVLPSGYTPQCLPAVVSIMVVGVERRRKPRLVSLFWVTYLVVC
jgi:hypothetical protein